MLQLDKNTLSDLEARRVEKIKIFFYGSGCSGTKVDVVEEFEISDDLKCLPLLKGVPEGGGISIYVEKKDASKFEESRITKTVKADHTGKEKIRYIYTSEKVLDRCGCGSSFSFEQKKLVLDLEKLARLKAQFKS